METWSTANTLLSFFFYNSTNLRFRDIYVTANNNKPTTITWLEQGAIFPPKLGVDQTRYRTKKPDT